MTGIKFGTDGWRAKIAEEFTFQNIQLVTQALVEHLKEKGTEGQGIAVGYDNRFQSEIFARKASEICSGAGIKTLLCNHSIPSPVLSFIVNRLNLAAGIMITASHNPPEWNGFKIKETFGGSAFPETTKAVEAKLSSSLKIEPTSKSMELFEPNPEYLNKLKSLVNMELIKKAPLNIIIDPMHGSGCGYFKQLGLDVTEIRGNRDPLFSGVNPEPLPINLQESMSFVAEAGIENRDKLTVCI
ncbi:MAG: phosphoglucomutase/phosphomannomutase family protein, partial [Candidatus Saganbacteria bacterium]|nr:phosphoglucomutase/phosphomannomutase family protein [Candidatus Saganbacteria bacterium]